MHLNNLVMSHEFSSCSLKAILIYSAESNSLPMKQAVHIFYLTILLHRQHNCKKNRTEYKKMHSASGLKSKYAH